MPWPFIGLIIPSFLSWVSHPRGYPSLTATLSLGSSRGKSSPVRISGLPPFIICMLLRAYSPQGLTDGTKNYKVYSVQKVEITLLSLVLPF